MFKKILNIFFNFFVSWSDQLLISADLISKSADLSLSSISWFWAPSFDSELHQLTLSSITWQWPPSPNIELQQLISWSHQLIRSFKNLFLFKIFFWKKKSFFLSADQISCWYQLIWSANQLILSDQLILLIRILDLTSWFDWIS